MKQKKLLTRLILSVLAVATVLSTVFAALMLSGNDTTAGSIVRLFDKDVKTNLSDYLDPSVVQKLPDHVKETDEISIILQTESEALLDAYQSAETGLSFAEFAKTDEALAIKAELDAKKAELISELDASGVSYKLGNDYDTVLGGFEIYILAGDFARVCDLAGDRASAIVGEVYRPAETQLVENKVNVYETGIFNSSNFAYDGTGTVVAVLDTGLDYYHTAFSVSNFTADRSQLGMTFENVSSMVGNTTAAKQESGLTASDVYVNEKVPFAFDYADHDSEVYPLLNNHGTHVAGIIAGKDSVITGVAPNAQLVIMKTFSDLATSARTSWILAALEDCVVLDVDVINMSLGTSCGFSRENDKETISGVYDKIRAAGISLIVAASNSYSSTYGSEKNGNLGLTSNPDSGTVGSPGTYAGALSVASVSGKKTPYLLYDGKIIYFTESTNRVSKEKNFFDEIFPAGTESMQLDYVTIPGVGRSADYTGIDVNGKVALIRRGSTTFEEKANVAEKMGAAAVIIYNNVSGDIKMNVGDTKIPVCSIGQDEGEMLAAAGTGKIDISRSQTSGPFMSDFSSWGPAPDLGIKPEITAHGGSIYSAVPGQSYDTISGTSMACPNVAGIAALLRQYVKATFTDIADQPVEVAAMVNRLLMSTADILYNTNGLPYAVRKQGAGLANLDKAAATAAYILTYDRKDGSVMDKTKIELGDDPQKTGVYNLKFSVKNFGATALSYSLSYTVMTEGVSETKTNDGKTTVDELGYLLSGAVMNVTKSENCTLSEDGKTVTVAAGQTATLNVTLTLSDTDKAYLNSSFANGMYVEGFLVLNNADANGVDLSIPYLAFYGDWTVAPIFDLDYYATNADELDDSIDLLDKTLPDAYATRPIGSVSQDFVSYLGAYYFQQNPTAKQIAASRDYISISNIDGTVHSLEYVWGGLLRNCASIVITITDDATGEVVFERVENDIRKSYGDGGSIYPANIDVGFDAAEQNLKNNSRYTVTLKGYLDYERDGGENNLSNTFTFPLVTDFQAPAVTGCEFYTEYDKSAKTTRLYAKVAIYDNHYAMSAMMGYVSEEDVAPQKEYVLNSFEKYLTPVYSSFNSTTYVTYELTDYVDLIRKDAYNKNCFTVAVYDYALNQATYEIQLPDDYDEFYFAEAENGLTLSPNETYTLTPLAYPGTEWTELLDYSVSNTKVAAVVNNKLVAVAPGKTMVYAKDPVTKKQASFSLTVLAEGDPGYVRYDKPVADNFTLTGFYVNKAYYQLNTDDRELGSTGDEAKFASSTYALSMYPSESVTLRWALDAYFPNSTEVVFESSNNDLVTVAEDGTITAVAEGFATVSVRVLMDGKSTYYAHSVSITVKNPYLTTGPSLTHYFGNGGLVDLPKDLGITEIGQFAFSNFDYVPKEEGEEISDETPETTKIWYLGDNTIEEVIIPEGVKSIGPYAFANLTALKKVTLPSTLERIDYGAFLGCTSLTTVNGIEHVKLINENAFYNCNLLGTLTFGNAIAISNYAFANNKNLTAVVLPAGTQSIGAFAFAGDTSLATITIHAEKLKLGQYAFSDCAITEIAINAAVLPTGLFKGCESLKNVTIGRDVAVIGEYAFRDTEVASFTVAEGNTTFFAQADKPYLLSADRTAILLVAPAASGTFSVTESTVTAIGNGAFSGNSNIKAVDLPTVKHVGDYAFAQCTKLEKVTFAPLESIGDYAFYGTKLTKTPDLSTLDRIGDWAFAHSSLTELHIPNGMTVGNSAFRECVALKTVTVGDNVKLGANAFRLDVIYNTNWGTSSYRDENGNKIYYYIYKSPLTSLTVGNNVEIGNAAFYGAAELQSVTLGEGAVIGDEAFYNNVNLRYIDLSKAVSIGRAAFSGDVRECYVDTSFNVPALTADGNYLCSYYAPKLQTVDLSAATTLGSRAFAYCRRLTSVALNSALTEIPASAFESCISLEIINLSNVKKIGEAAFAESALTQAYLLQAETIDKNAFIYSEQLAAVTFGTAGVSVEDSAFAYCASLASVEGMNLVTKIGNYAFALTALTEADLSAATSVGDAAFLKDRPTAFEVNFGDTLTNMGDNPFAFCILTPFSATVSETFNNKEYLSTVYTFDLGSAFRVIDGSLYRIVPRGYELITYASRGEDTAKVADGTVRISAMAFAGTDVVKVLLPQSLVSIGHKAFYGCEKLTLVVFTSYDAPILEEEFDFYYYASGENIPATGDYSIVEADGDTQGKRSGLGIVPYFMWNVVSNPYNVYYGATFSDYIGHIDNSLIMSRPVNGRNYDSFIFAQYFNTSIDGSAAPDEITLAAIAAINALPDVVSLADKALVQAARAAYDKISLHEQRALVADYYPKLQEAEKRIANLEYLENGDPVPEPEPPVEKKPMTTAEILCIVFGSLFLVSTVAIIVLLVLLRKKNKSNTPPSSPEDGETAEDTALDELSEESNEASEEAETSEDVPAEEGAENADEEERAEKQPEEISQAEDATESSPADAGEEASSEEKSEQKSDEESERA
ncbi:MAG: leucine-rich repeat protein [Clostridia bacterium]|nr:leucine-rich repeat protein [Clostridia bacterium]